MLLARRPVRPRMPHPPDSGVQGDPRPELDGTAGLSGPGGVAPPDPPSPSLAGTPKAPLRSGERASGALTAGPDPRLTNRMTHTDAATVALARDGNSEAFRALVEHHSRAVYRLAHRMTGNPSDAEDVVQETFLRAYKQLGRFESRANFGTWLHRIAVNCSIDLIRARPRRESSHDVADLEVMNAPPVTSKVVEASPERLMLSAEVKERISSAMTSLSQMERAAFVLRHFEGHSIEEISRTLGLKVNAAKHSIFRAVKKMRVALEPFVPTE
jgi:RNA polymerase sigma-70 factor (ECF subfamily)